MQRRKILLIFLNEWVLVTHFHLANSCGDYRYRTENLGVSKHHLGANNSAPFKELNSKPSPAIQKGSEAPGMLKTNICLYMFCDKCSGRHHRSFPSGRLSVCCDVAQEPVHVRAVLTLPTPCRALR